MIDFLLVVFLACGKPVYVVMQPLGEPMKVYSQASMGKERWPEFLKIVEKSKLDPSIGRLELPVEDQTTIVCGTST